MAVIVALCAGLYLGKILFEPVISVGIVKNYPHFFMDRDIKIKGIVRSKGMSVGNWIKMYWLCDEASGDCLWVKTNRTILPPPNHPLTIKARLEEPFAIPVGNQLLLVEQDPGLSFNLIRR